MDRDWDNFKGFLATAARETKVRKRLLAVVAVICFLQLYFVRELVAAELLFGLGFVVLLVIAGVVYALGAIGERSFDLMEAGVRRVAPLARRGYDRIEEISKKPSRHPHSESAR
jgi:hypothetical protein